MALSRGGRGTGGKVSKVKMEGEVRDCEMDCRNHIRRKITCFDSDVFRKHSSAESYLLQQTALAECQLSN
ncbi:Uncharacterized protein APZ42_029127 [Daphnia magna]|uniref:Uncharacterized protein n=1 Tax=Daphnia magna TaxID=35525 RepID=A0A164PWS1_9CRUS|nr:Uncharacterized protein APZ42_029127 [Daphnia magna]